MKSFLEELEKSNSHWYAEMPSNSESKQKRQELRRVYGGLVGHRALFTDNLAKESRVVTIKEVNSRFVTVSYKYFGLEYEGEVTTTINYLSLLCGDSELQVE